ncbi:MAG: O-antigen ligase family protein [Vicinamibacteria bacterium]
MKLERAQLALVAAVAATCSVSIFAAQLLTALAAIVFAVRLARREVSLPRLPLDGPTLAFCVWTLLSAAFSQAPLVSQATAKKLVLFVLLYLAVDAATAVRDRERLLDAALLGGLVLAAGSLVQYHFLGFDTMDNRPRSFLGHYMTASGLLMATVVLAAARLAFAEGPPVAPARTDLRRLAGLAGALLLLSVLRATDVFALDAERIFVALLAAAAAYIAIAETGWPAAGTRTLLAATALGLSSWALLVSRTRNAWLGTLAGLAAIALLRAPRLLWALGGAVLLVLVLRPEPVMARLTVTDASSRDRYFMWQAGIDMIRDRPVFGQGPRMVESNYPAYRWPGAPNPATPHLHNNVLQIAAERGLPCLAWWLWWVAAAMGDALREARRRAWTAVASFALLVAVMVAGLFEYNFGDSEILMLLLIVCALPYALRRERGEEEVPAPVPAGAPVPVPTPS